MISTSSSIDKANIAKLKVFEESVQNDLAANMVSRWKLDSNANDSWGASNGTPTNITYGSGYDGTINGAAVFNGTSSYINCGNNVNSKIDTGTISAWVKTSNAGGSHRGIVVKQGAYGMFLFNNIFVIYDWTTSSNATTNINLADGLWHYVLASFDQNVSNGTKLYIDGVLKLTTTMGISNQSSSLAIGNGSTVTTDQIINGYIDDVRLYNAVLSSSQIKQNYVAGLNLMLANRSMPEEEYNQRIESLGSNF